MGKEISEVRKQLLEKADAAEQAYNEGYGLLDQYRYGETRPYLQLVGAVPLPDLSLALGQAYRRCGEVAFELRNELAVRMEGRVPAAVTVKAKIDYAVGRSAK